MSISAEVPIQSLYPSAYQHCYGCGTAASKGHHLESFWDGETARVEKVIEPEFLGVEGFVYGGMLASLIDCHAIATAAAAAGFADDDTTGVLQRYVTGSLNIKFVAPTPLTDEPIVLEAKVVREEGRKSYVDVELLVGDKVCVVASVVAVKIPETMQLPT